MTETVSNEQGIKRECEDREKATFAEVNRMTTSRRTGKRGRKPAKVDVKAKLERSRQSARECRARKKLRYQYLEELVTSREKAIYALRKELEMCKEWCMSLDRGKLTPDICETLETEKERGLFTDDDDDDGGGGDEPKIPRTKDWCELTVESSDGDSSDVEADVDERVDKASPLGPVVSRMTVKGKGVGKASAKSEAESQDNKDLSHFVKPWVKDLSHDGVTSRSSSASSNAPRSVSAGAAASLTMNKPGLDMSKPIGVSTELDPSHANREQTIVSESEQNKPPLSSGNSLPMIMDLLTENGSSPDLALNPSETLNFGFLSEADINDVLEAIEKDSHS